MSHKFSSGLFFGQGAWHGLGVTLAADSPERFSVADSIRIAGMDYECEKRQLSFPAADGSIRQASGKFAVVRKDTESMLGVVGDDYHVLQNREIFQWFQPYLETGEVAFETCGTLAGGSIPWVLAKIQRDNMQIAAGDSVAKYLLLSSSHDGSKATSVGFCPIRVVCWNTLSAGLRDSSSVLLRVKHTSKQHESLAAIRETINLIDQTFEATAAQYRKLAECGIDAGELRKYVKLCLELPEDDNAISKRQKSTLDSVIQLCLHGSGNENYIGEQNSTNVWAAYNGLTEYFTHHAGRSPDTKLRSSWYGENRKRNDRALSLAMQLAN